MNPLTAWLDPVGGAPPRPLDFAAPPAAAEGLCLVLPEGHPGTAALRSPPLPAPPAAVLAALCALAAEEPRCRLLAQWPERGQAQWLLRSPLLRLPTLLAAEARPRPGGAALFLLARRLAPGPDGGAGRALLARWLAALPGRLPPAPEASAPAPADVPPDPPFLAALMARAPGRHLLLTGETPDAPALLLQALAGGAASARVLGPRPPSAPDAALMAAGRRLGLEALAEDVIRAAGVGHAPPIPSALARSDAPAAWWRADPPEAPDLAARLGPVDLLAEGAGLEGQREPLRRLAALRRTGARRLLLATAALPEGIIPGFGAESLWPAEALGAERARALEPALRAHGLALPQLSQLPEGLSEAAARAAGIAAPWWWFMGEAALRDLLADAGWTPRAQARQGLTLLLEAEA
ncbi:hypothetical protein [Rubritepida flocculans]|uniref:hypothetical protein n=1 Tax=Rubritepida flocculans TaxID=182403 RepID=UPI00041FFD11|nr:hypothetical protein [Rubritepida flocculans]